MGNSPCHYCGTPNTDYGIDRINSDKGYVCGNMRPCCKKCNMAKSDMTEDEFLNHIQKITNFLKIPA